MKYTRDYSGMDSISKHKRAIRDIKQYLGGDRFNELTRDFQDVGSMSFESFSKYAWLAGIQGYPVKAWYELCFPT